MLGPKDAHGVINSLYAEDVLDLDCLFTAGSAIPLPNVMNDPNESHHD
jgi:hypothetical protein